jgi:hypothetical protein
MIVIEATSPRRDTSTVAGDVPGILPNRNSKLDIRLLRVVGRFFPFDVAAKFEG